VQPPVTARRLRRAPALVALGLTVVGCPEPQEAPDLADDPVRFVEDVAYRRAILERDLTGRDNDYATLRLEQYGRAGEGWEELDARDPFSRGLRPEDVAALQRGESLELDAAPAAKLMPGAMPETAAGWEALGRRVFYEYPLRADSTYEQLAALPGALEDVGFILLDGEFVGLRVFREDGDDRTRIGPACAQCHAGIQPDGEIGCSLPNPFMDVGAARLRAAGVSPDEIPPEQRDGYLGRLARLGPGRVDVLADSSFNPYAVPGMGGLADLPYLHHNANWFNRGVATVAIRSETLFITSAGRRSRIPRTLAWAIAVHFRSQPPPPPLFEAPPPGASRGKDVFGEAGCGDCHTPPLYTSERVVSVEEVGTDPAAGRSPARRSGNYRIPSLRGVGTMTSYLHHGAVPTLEVLFDPAREEPGHPWGQELDEADRRALIEFLRSI